MALSVVHLSPLGSQASFNNNAQRIENVTDWDSIAKKYRAIMWPEEEETQHAVVATHAHGSKPAEPTSQMRESGEPGSSS